MMDWIKETFSFADKELLMMVGIVIMAIILLRIVFKSLYRFRVLKLIISVLVIGGLVWMSVNYVQTHKEIFSAKTRFYVYGKTGFISTAVRTFEMDSTKTNLFKGGSGRVIVNVPVGTKILTSESSNKEIKLEDLKSGDILQVYCKESSIEGDEVTAVKIIKKYDN